MAPKYKLTYFNATALGEPIRMLFHYGGIEFEDFRFERHEWPMIKPKMPFGQAPILEIDNKVVNQSRAIARYVAKLVKMDGVDAEEDLLIDSMVDNIDELRICIAAYWYETDPKAKESKKGNLLMEKLPSLLCILDSYAKVNQGHFINKKLTWADFYFVGILDYLNFMLGYEMIENYRNLKEVCKNVTSIPSIEKYLNNRPVCEF